jgi:ABC-2 type transport system ATP-binding protein
VSVSSDEAGVLTVTGMDAQQIGITAAGHGITLLELTPQQASLEDAFMQLTHDSAEYQAPAPGGPLAGAGRIPS